MAVPDLPEPNAPATSVVFAAAARTIASSVRQLGVSAPGFRCPPRLVGVDRAVRRRGPLPGDAVVSVRLRGRPWVAVAADMVEGVVVANQLTSPHADRVRTGLWEAIGYGVAGDTAEHDTAESETDGSDDGAVDRHAA